jgi:hypothetical protein
VGRNEGVLVPGMNAAMAGLSTYGYRLLRAAMLDRSLYEEAERDRRALSQAIATIVLASLAAGIGAGGAHGSSAKAFAVFSVTALAVFRSGSTLNFPHDLGL